MKNSAPVFKQDLFSIDESSGSSGGPLDDLFASVVQSVSKGADSVIQGVANNTVSSITQPTPDLTAAAAQSPVSTFVSSKVGGVSAPLLLIGAAALIFLVMRK
jgi:hypothetical protein